MRNRERLFRVLTAPVLAAAMALPRFAEAAQGYLEQARRSVDLALSQADAGQWDTARALLRQTSSACPRTLSGKGCARLVELSLGFLAAKQALSEDRVPGRALLATARGYFLEVLEEYPDDTAALRNLAEVCEQLGDTGTLEAALKRAVAFDSDGLATAALMLGRLYRDSGGLDREIGLYRDAIAADPSSAALRSALIDALSISPPSELPALIDLGMSWELQFPALSEQAYGAVIARGYRDVPQAAQEALVRWVALVGRSRPLSAAFVGALASDWHGAEIADLQRTLEHPERDPAEGNWWLGSDNRRHALASASLGLALDAANAHDEPQAAAAILEQVAHYAPKARAYATAPLRGWQPVSIDALTELGTLYLSVPGLDPDGRKLRDVLGGLFEDKALAYAQGNARSIQRLHTVLGILLARQGTWQSTSPFANAEFQLTHALSTAGERMRTEHGYYQPQPDLQALLAAGYQAHGQLQPACKAWLAAAQAYLDVDDLGAAEQAHEHAARLIESDSDVCAHADSRSLSADDIARIVQLRRSLPQSLAAGGSVVANIESNWLFDESAADYQEAFLRRQRYKTLADIAVQYPDKDPWTKAFYATRALALALDKLPTLTTEGDLVRLDKVRQLSLAGAQVPRTRMRLSEDPKPYRTDAKSWTVFLAARDVPLFATVSGDAVLAMRVAIALYQNDLLQRGRTPCWSLAGGSVTLPEDTLAPPATPQPAIAAIPGLKEIRIEHADGSIVALEPAK